MRGEDGAGHRGCILVLLLRMVSDYHMTMDMTMVYQGFMNQARRSNMTDTTNVLGRSRTMKASEFKAKCLRLMDEVATSGQEIVITKNGRPTARLLPWRKRFEDWFGADRGKIEIIGDITSPIDIEWEAEVNPNRVLSP